MTAPPALAASMTLTMILVFGILFGLLAGVGFYLDFGIFAMAGIAVALGIVQWYIGPNIIKWSSNMVPLDRREYQWVEETVRIICMRNRVKIPEIAIENTGMPNAFVFGRTNKTATLTLSRGLLSTITEEEVNAVIAHEIGHIKHNDMVVMTVISVIPTIAYFIARGTLFRRSSGGKGGTAILFGIGAFAVYFVTNLLTLYFSRLREYHADNFAAHQIKPSHLANALAKITYGLSIHKQQKRDSLLRSFYAVDPVSSSMEISRFSEHYKDQHISEEEVKDAMDWERRNVFSKFGEIFRTHPLTYKRIEKLYSLKQNG